MSETVGISYIEKETFVYSLEENATVLYIL